MKHNRHRTLSPTPCRAILWFSACFFLPFTLFGQQRPRSEVLAEQIAALNQELGAAQTALPGAAQSAILLTQREALLWELIAADPARALAMGLPSNLSAQLRASNPRSPIESEGEWEGEPGVSVADDFAGQRSLTQWYLQTSGERLEVFFAGPHPRGSGLIGLRGVRARNRIAVATSEPRTSPQAATAAPLCTTIGQQNIAVLMVTTPANPSFPAAYTSSYFQQAFFGASSGSVTTDSVNRYWQDASYGKTSAAGEVFGPFALSQNYSCDQLSNLAADAVNSADSTVDFTQYSRVAFTFPVQSCTITGFGAIGGLSDVGCTSVSSPSKGTLIESHSWYPIYPTQQTSDNLGTFAHELGHALGLNHSSTADYGAVPLGAPDNTGTLVEYGDPFSVMGGSGGDGQYVAEHKSQILHWLGSDGYQEALSAGTWNLLPLETASGIRALRVLRDPVTSSWLWLEYRQPIGDSDSSFAQLQNSGQSNVFSGALIHYENPDLDPGHSYLLDFTATSTPNNFDKSALVSGSSWSDPFSLLTLTVSNANDGVLPVTVSYDQPCAGLAFSSTTFPASGGTGTLTITAAPTCVWTASTATSWITFSGTISGQGNGTVSFSVAANSGSTQRSGYISAQRQSVRLTQAGSGPAVTAVSPIYGSGNTGQFTFQFSDPLGYADITFGSLDFQGSPGCSINMASGSDFFELSLLNDAGSQYLGPLYLNGSGTTISNSQCLISASGSSATGSGNSLQVTLQINFFAAFGGSHRITASISGSGGSSPEVPVGTWTVPFVQQPGVTIQASTAGAPFQLDDGSTYQAPVTFYWSAGSQHTITWLSSVSGQPGARYAFQNWADGGSNPRTITVSSAASVTYTANVKAQYLLTITQAPAVAGTVAAVPASADGFYDAGTTVQLTPMAATGYNFWYFFGDLSGSAVPQNITMSAPRAVTVNYYCVLTFPAYLGSPQGPGPATGLLQFQTGAGCSWTISSNEPWLTLTGALSGTGSGSVFYNFAENTGASRMASVTLAGDININSTIAATQEASGSSRPTISSFSPTSGTGANQIFRMQAWDTNGYQAISQVNLTFDTYPAGNPCSIIYATFGGSSYLFLEKDDASGSLSLALPSSGTIANSRCQVNGGQFSISGVGNVATLAIGMTFFPAYSGDKLIQASAQDSSSGLFAAYSGLGHWNPTFAVQTIAFGALLTQIVGNAPFTLNASASSGLLVAFASNSTAVCAVSGSTLTLVSAGTCSITASQPGDNATWGPAASVTVTFTVDPVFGDVSSESKAFITAIDDMLSKGISAGCQASPLEYCPSQDVTRGQMAVFIIRSIYGSNNFTYTQTPYFTDATPGSVGAVFPFIQKMRDLGITGGCTPTTYCPNDNVTRGQMAVFIILARYGSIKFDYPSTPYFTDATTASVGGFFKYIQKMKQDNITAGCGKTTYCPNDNVTRDQMAVFLLVGGFNLAAPTAPVLSSVSPTTGGLGDTINVTLTGANTHFAQGMTTVTAAAGITVGAVTVNSATSVTVTLTIAGNATPNPTSLLVTTPVTAGTEEVVLPNGFTITSDPAAGAIAYWNGNGTTANSISSMNGMLINGATYASASSRTQGIPDAQAFSLNGTNAYVQAAAGETGTLSGARTLAAWVYTNPFTGLGAPILTGGSTLAASDIFGITGTTGTCSSGGQYQLYVDHGGTCYVSDISLAPGVWSFVAVTFDGSRVVFYIDGVASLTVPAAQMSNYGLATLEVGGNTLGGTSTQASFNGLLSEVQVYNRALTQAEIQGLYAP